MKNLALMTGFNTIFLSFGSGLLFWATLYIMLIVFNNMQNNSACRSVAKLPLPKAGLRTAQTIRCRVPQSWTNNGDNPQPNA